MALRSEDEAASGSSEVISCIHAKREKKFSSMVCFLHEAQ
jgi:hypothetical protein